MATIHVRAKVMGFYQKRRRPGDKFHIDEKLFSTTWMERLDAPKPPAEDGAAAADGETLARVIRDLRKRFFELFGKKAPSSLDADGLKAEIAKKEAAA